MDVLGPNLMNLFQDKIAAIDQSQNIKRVCIVGQKMVLALKDLHDEGILHRDIKPDNFCAAAPKSKNIENENICIIDFGLSKSYIKDGHHIPYKEGKKLCGTARYCSLSTHMGYE